MGSLLLRWDQPTELMGRFGTLSAIQSNFIQLCRVLYKKLSTMYRLLFSQCLSQIQKQKAGKRWFSFKWRRDCSDTLLNWISRQKRKNEIKLNELWFRYLFCSSDSQSRNKSFHFFDINFYSLVWKAIFHTFVFLQRYWFMSLILHRSYLLSELSYKRTPHVLMVIYYASSNCMWFIVSVCLSVIVHLKSSFRICRNRCVCFSNSILGSKADYTLSKHKYTQSDSRCD